VPDDEDMSFDDSAEDEYMEDSDENTDKSLSG